jgi:intracellular multiplication protein IcmN
VLYGFIVNGLETVAVGWAVAQQRYSVKHRCWAKAQPTNREGFYLKQSTNKVAGFAIACVAALMLGCQPTAVRPIDDAIPLPTQVAGASDANIVALERRLSQSGVRVISMGQNYLISIPAGLLFESQSPQLTWGSYQLLNTLVCYLQQFRKVSLTVNAYSNPYVSRKREHALTLARARAMSKYLWSQNIDSRFIFTHGLGSDKPIGVLKRGGEGSLNARIEITFRRTVA